jgi:hypothetical protein
MNGTLTGALVGIGAIGGCYFVAWAIHYILADPSEYAADDALRDNADGDWPYTPQIFPAHSPLVAEEAQHDPT